MFDIDSAAAAAAVVVVVVGVVVVAGVVVLVVELVNVAGIESEIRSRCLRIMGIPTQFYVADMLRTKFFS